MTTWNIAKQRQLDQLIVQKSMWMDTQLPMLTQELSVALGIEELTTNQALHIIHNASTITSILNKYIP